MVFDIVCLHPVTYSYTHIRTYAYLIHISHLYTSFTHTHRNQKKDPKSRLLAAAKKLSNMTNEQMVSLGKCICLCQHVPYTIHHTPYTVHHTPYILHHTYTIFRYRGPRP
ncbi:hypothetical protein EON63_08495 [archaeon]|nr:MAG: hypothetical protein EON63_08495 [archaeon]